MQHLSPPSQAIRSFKVSLFKSLLKMNPLKSRFLVLAAVLAAPLLSVDVAAQKASSWANYTHADRVTDVLEESGKLHVATRGGLVTIDVASDVREVLTKANSGLPSNMIEALSLKAGGGIWVGTYDAGVVVMQGVERLDDFSSSNSALPGNTIYAFTQRSSGPIYAATSGGMAELNQNGVTDLSMPNGWAWGGKLTTLSNTGSLYCATGNEVFTYQSGVWTDALNGASIQPINIISIATDSNGSLVILTPTDLFCQDGASWDVISLASFPGTGAFEALAASPSGQVYVAKGGVISNRQNGVWIPIANNPMGIQQVEFMEVTNAGDVYVADGDMLVKIKTNGAFKSYPLSNSTLTTNDIKKVVTAASGESYALDLNGKIHQMAPTWTSLSTIAWNQNAIVSDIALSSQGVLFASVKNQGLFYYNGSIWKLAANNFTGLPSENINQLAADATGGIWMATANAGMVNYNNGAITKLNSSNSILGSDNITQIASNATGTVFAITGAQELVELSGPNVLLYSLAGLGMPNANVVALAVNSQGEVVISDFGHGLSKYKLGQPLQWLTSSVQFATSDVMTVSFDTQNRLWAGSRTEGLGLYDDNAATWVTYTYANSGLSSDHLTSISAGVNGSMWLCTAVQPGGNGLITNGGISHFIAGKQAGLGTDALKAGQKLLAYPNPVPSGATLTVEWTKKVGTSGTMRLLDQSGKIVSSNTFDNGGEIVRVAMPVDGLAPGVYLVSVIDALGNASGYQKVVIE